MKNFILMLIVTVVVYGAVLPVNLLEEIHREVQNISREEMDNIHVPNPTKLSEVCSRKFFCLAEKSLKTAKLDKLNRLLSLLKKYNEKEGVNCEDNNPNNTYLLLKLLEEIKNCTTSILMNGHNKTHHKGHH